MICAVKYAGRTCTVRQADRRICRVCSGIIADMATKTEAAEDTCLRGMLTWLTAGQPFSKEAAMCKLNAAENARFVTNLALQIHGGYGYMKDYPLERMYRDAKITEIYEGTSEIHKVVIARAVMKRSNRREYSI